MEREVNLGTRLGSMILDQIIMSFGLVLFFVPMLVMQISSPFEVTHDRGIPALTDDATYFALIGFVLYLCKDVFNGRSLAKRMLGLQVVDNETWLAASPVKCFVRNIFCGLWMIELILTLASPSRRLGDWVAGTRVVHYDPHGEQPKTDFLQVILSLGMAYGLMLLFLIPFESLESGLNSMQSAIVESSRNDNAGNELQNLFQAEMGDELTADVRVYDEIEDNPGIKYLSVILTLNDDYLDDEDDFEWIHESVVKVVYTQYPQGTFIGQFQYLYESPGRRITRAKYVYEEDF